MSGTLSRVVAGIARLYPWPVEASDELCDALAFLDGEYGASTVVRAGYGAGLVAICGTSIAVALVPGQLRAVTVVLGSVLALAVVHLVHATPKVAATARRTSALGAAPDLVARAVLRMRLTPAPEQAAAFAAQTSDGVLADALEAHVRRGHHTGTAGLTAFGDDWSDLFPSLRRACSLITVAGRTPATDRRQLLDRALAVVLDGTRETLQSFAANIRGPVTALYAFGVLLPTALVALLPAAGAAGVVVTPSAVVVLYDIALPVALSAAAVWLLTRRPVAFPPPAVTREHPDVADRRLQGAAAGVGVALGAWLVCARTLPTWGPPVAAVGLGSGTGLVVATQPVVAVYERIRAVEDGLSDALELVGRRVANGQAVETAVAQVSDELDGPTGAVLADGARQQRQLHVGVHEAFLGRHGVLDSVPSRRVRGSLALLSVAADEGAPAGSALLALAEHLDDLQQIEREARHTLTSVCRTLTNTATVFAPLVAGATVALAGGISGGTELAGGQTLQWLGGPVGVYVLALATILRTLSVGLVRGVDRELVGYRVGRALVTATVTYLGSYLLVAAIL